MKRCFFLFPLLIWLFVQTGCNGERKPSDNGAFVSSPSAAEDHPNYDLTEIQESGELIVATLSGPDTYYDYQGEPMGLQYAYAAAFAKEEGVRVRVEISHDTLELFDMLKRGDVDLIALPLPEDYIRKNGGMAAGLQDSVRKLTWAIRPDATALAAALNQWYRSGGQSAAQHKEIERDRNRHKVRRSVRAPYISRQKGIISSYDHHFREAAKLVGWDWHLIAAQCYQESGFDPAAVSGAGARGLMQIMPSTAQYLGVPVDQLFHPDRNIAAAAKYLRKLNSDFQDIRDGEERIKFVLGAYNGGPGHIRDAMRLTQKHRGNAQRWDDVVIYVRKLSEPKYYRDPSVKYGYMIGQETANYVSSVLERWRFYGKSPVDSRKSSTDRSENRTGKRRTVKIYTPDDPEFTGIPAKASGEEPRP